jgi:hypothetical protein
MSAYPRRDEPFPPVYARTFSDFDPALTLHTAPTAPVDAQYLPAELIVQAEATDVLEWTDIEGTVNSITFTAATAGLHRLRIPAATLTANTTVTAVTVLWSQAG